MSNERAVVVASRFSMCKPGIILLIALAMGITLTWSGPAYANNKYASIVIDAETGDILHQRNAYKSLHPASLTKVMTLYMVFEALEDGKLALRERIRISKRAASMQPSKINIPEGSSIRVRDAIYALVTKSANDVAVALAEHLGGTEANFARMMTRKARHLGLHATTFRNASGLHHPRQRSTARDMAKLAQIVIKEHPEYYNFFSKKDFYYRGKRYRNHNRLLSKYPGMDGMKTGYINAAGFNLIASAVRDDRRIIGVVFGGRTAHTRNKHMASLLDRGFKKMGTTYVASAGSRITRNAPSVRAAFNAPKPDKKPSAAILLASLKTSAGGIRSKRSSSSNTGEKSNRWAFLDPNYEGGLFSKLIGEGDADPNISKRFETSLIAIAAHAGAAEPKFKNTEEKTKPVTRSSVAKKPQKSWAIQVGAFKSRAVTDKVIQQALQAVPGQYAAASPIIAPLRTRDGWLFRARLSGYSKQQAFSACSYLSDCIPIAP